MNTKLFSLPFHLLLLVTGILLYSSTVGADTFADNFNSTSYSNQNGTNNWASDWIETGDNGNPNSGDIQITGGELALDDNDNSIRRQVNLSSYFSATLSFDYREVSFDNATDYVDLQIRTGGGSWILLQRFAGPTDDSGNYSVDISAYLASDTEIRFITSPTFSDFDDFYVDNLVIDATGTPPTPVAYYHLDETVWNGTANEVEDFSGNNLHGVGVAVGGNYPTPESTTPAIVDPDGTCGYGVFDGANNGYLEVSDPGSGWDLDLPNELTVTVWIRPRSVPGSGLMTIVSKDENFEFHIDNSGQINWWWGGGARELTTTGLPIIPNSIWYHVAITYESGEQKIYINGVERAAKTQTGTLTVNNDSLYIGTDLAFNSRTFDGYIDEVKIYDRALSQTQVQAVMAETHTCPNTVLAHYGISFDNGLSYNDSTAVTCETTAVTILAHSLGHLVPVTPVAGTTINLSTSTGQGFWSSPNFGSVVDNGNGNAVYTWAGNDSVTLQFNHTQPAINPSPVNININAGTANPTEDSSEDPDIQFFEAGFRFVDTGDNPSIANQTAAVESATYSLQAIRTDTQTNQCIGVFANGAQIDLELGAECNDPLTCAGLQVEFTNNGNSATLATSDNNGVAGSAAYTTINNVLFGADSKADFTFNYPDVGALSLHARYEIENNGGGGSGDFMLGSSNGFIVSPANFVITTINAGATNNPGTTSGGSGFIASGDPFAVTVEVRNALGNLTPNYGNETIAEAVTLNFSSLSFPAGGSIGVLTNTGSFSATATAGEFENTQIIWDEVGTFTAFASVADGNYLGAGDVVGSVSGNIGRFYPAGFELISSAVGNSCGAGGYSYLSQPDIDVAYELEARNRGGAAVLNYDNTDLTYVAASISVHGEDSNDGNDFSSRMSVMSGLWDDGVMTVNDVSAAVARTVDGSLNIIPDGPFANFIVGLQITDVDNANFFTLDFKPGAANNCVVDGDCDSRMLAGTLNLLFGRLRIQDVHGPESSAIPMVWQTEFWNGSQFVVNSDDHCTLLPLSAVSFVGAATTVDAVNDIINVAIGGASSAFNFADPVGGSDCLDPSNIGFCDGSAGLFYGAPGSVVTYPIDVDLSALNFLQGDWNQDGNYNDSSHPRTYVRFQHYRGHDRVIYWRERLQ